MDGVGFGRAFQILVFLSFFLPAKTVSNTNTNSSSNALCIEMERDALLRFKKELKDPSNRLSSWVPETDCCKWVGIHCDSLTRHVKELKLANTRYVKQPTDQAERIASENSKLKGNLSDSILNLKHVSHIDLSYNDFGGIQIPSFLGSLVSLNYLNLTGSGFQGLIPHQLGNLSNLQRLGLRGNSPFFYPKLYSENLQWLQGLRSLLSLDLSYANLSKASNWLLDINKLPFLVELRLSYCELNRITPLTHVNFTSLSILDISSNHFYTFIPKWILKLSNLVSLDLSLGHFKGPLPGGSSNLTSLKNLNLANNGFNSSLPKWLFSLTSLTSLDLSGNNFEGSIPHAIQNLSALTYLDLSEIFSFNSTTIPSCLYSLHNLQILKLHSLNFQGEISNDIINLTNLVSLDLERSELEGNIPRSIGSLCNLRYIFLSYNKFSEKLSDVFDIVSTGCLAYSLISLTLEGNNISGHFTNHIAKLKILESLDLEGNFISGPIPESIGNLSSLKDLYLARNELRGTLPKSMGLLSSLQQLSISNNRLEGIVSEVHFANLKNLKDLFMSENNLTLSFSVGWVPPFNLDYINLRSCNLGPQFPEWLKSQKNFIEIDLSNAKILDIVPDWFWSLSTSYTYLNLSHNQLSGKIPDFLLNAQFTTIYLGSNKFHGNLSRVSSNVTELDLSNNSFSGNMSHFLCHSRNQNNRLEILHLGDNLLSGNIPDCWTEWMSLKVVKLGSNILSGKLPNSMGSLSNLESLHLRNNSLFGKIPHFLKNCLKLRTLDLGLNAFQGSIPTWIGTNLSNLMVLGLRSNQLSGLIPDELCQLSSLQIMDIGNNNLIGSISHCFGNFIAMATKKGSYEHIFYSVYSGEFLENAYVVTKGEEFQYNNILALMTSMDLSDNKLSGEIPQEITNLVDLRSLNLSGNHLNGSIPQQIGSMASIESLDLSRNQLSGQIPPSMSKLTFLNYLNLSYNNLSGQIPSSSQLQGFDPWSFIGNNELCGLPLTNSCQSEGTTSDTKNGDAKEGDENYNDEWFYLSMAIGFVVGFWGIWGPLLISKTWRHTYFRHLSSLWHKFN